MKKKKTNKNRKYQKPLSLYGVKPEDALAAFLMIKSKRELRV